MNLSIYLFIYLSITIYLYYYLSIYLSVDLPIYLSIDTYFSTLYHLPPSMLRPPNRPLLPPRSACGGFLAH